jgi:hypothetical protein
VLVCLNRLQPTRSLKSTLGGVQAPDPATGARSKPLDEM